MDILSKIERAHFMASEADIEAMARARHEGEEYGSRAAGTYLKILVALTAAQIGGGTAHLSRRRGRHAASLNVEEVAAHMAALDTVNTSTYAAVLRAVVTPDIEKVEGLSPEVAAYRALERNRRTNYARTALTALRLFVAAGRDVRDLDVATVTKDALRATAERYAPPTHTVTAGRLVRSAERAGARIVEEALELASVDQAQAEKLLAALMASLQDVLDKVRSGELVPQGDQGTTTIITQAVQQRARASPQRAPAG